ncbi:uncharacterized protein EI90DRAFT_2908495 [Cantharellus anzutake]|uniref:uncharacterized protein n=1 Tax=Cantharellus anzutake TaxID=1750568 RepID=UPI001904F4BC|nr:uncharacterized protein EI90DRAFT_2908495 [Cantharellus anzutake]KAF8338794.1 hypothetical protein EI90DRAFT_2908495 [Cantharellus anzutake]
MSVDQEREREPEDRWSEINDEREVDHHLGQSWGEPGLKGYAGGSAWNDPTPARSSTIKSYSRGFGSTVPLDHDDRIQESGGKGLSDAHHAMYGSHRLAQDRFMWILPYQHDPRVVSMHNFIEQSSSALAKLGFHKYLNTREKGALFVNVDYTSEEAPTEPAFDWLKFPDLQRTRDRTLQQSVAANNPAKTCLVFMFLVSKSGNSVGMWRRKIPVPQSLQTAYQDRVRRLESEVRDKVYVVKIE